MSGSSDIDIQSLLQQLMPQQQQAAAPVPERSITSLLGGALGGGVDQLAPEDRETAGGRALMNFGIAMLAQSGYRPRSQQVTFGEALAHGLSGAQRAVTDSEMVSSARRADRREELTKAQELRLATLKEAIPLLKLQQEQRSLAALQGGGSTAGGTGTPNLGTVTGPVVPFVAKNLPQGVSAEEDQLVRTVIGEAGGEPLAGQQGVAAVVKNRMASSGQSAQDVIFRPNAFEPWNNPATRAKLEAIDPASPQYQQILNSVVRPVMSGQAADPTGGATHFYSPKAQKALGRETPDWGVGTPSAEIGGHRFYKAGYAPPQAGGGVAARNPGSVTTAGPGVPSSGATAAPAAPSAAGVPAPGAAPAAPSAEYTQEGVPIAPAGAAPAAAPAGPAALPPPQLPPRAPFEFQMPVGMTAEQAERYNPNLAPEVDARLRQRLAAASTTGEGQAAAKDLAEAQQKKRDDAAKAIGALRDKQLEEHNKQQDALQTEASKAHYAVLQEQRAAAQKAGETAEAHRRAVEMARIQGEEARRTEDAKSENSYVGDQRKKFSDQREGARTVIDDLTMLDALSEHAGKSTPLENIVLPNGKTARDYLVSLGVGSKAQQEKWGAQQAYAGALNKTVQQLRNGISMGALSDRDLSFLENMAPNLLQNPETRKAITAYLLQSQHRKRQYIDTVERLWDGGDGVDKNGRKITWAKALKIAEDELPDIVPAVPKEYAGWDDEAKAQWFVTKKIRPGALVRGATGKLMRYAPGETAGTE